MMNRTDIMKQAWLALLGGVLLAGQAPGGDLDVEGDLNVTGDLHVEGRITAGTAAAAPNHVVRKAEMEAEVAGQIESALPEFRQNPDTLAVRENLSVIASGEYSHAEGIGTVASGLASHAEGVATIAEGWFSHAEGEMTEALGGGSHAEGAYTVAGGVNSHAEGAGSVAGGGGAHAEGYATTAAGEFSHAEGYQTVAAGHASHAEGSYTTAAGANSHAQGEHTWAEGHASHAGGVYARAKAGHDRAFIHAAGTAQHPKETQYPDTAHFDKLYAFESWGETPPQNAVLKKAEADQRYMSRVGTRIEPQGDILMGCYTAEP